MNFYDPYYIDNDEYTVDEIPVIDTRDYSDDELEEIFNNLIEEGRSGYINQPTSGRHHNLFIIENTNNPATTRTSSINFQGLFQPITIVNDPNTIDDIENTIQESFNAQPISTIHQSELPPFFVQIIRKSRQKKDFNKTINLSRDNFNKINKVLNIEPYPGVIRRGVEGKGKKPKKGLSELPESDEFVKGVVTNISVLNNTGGKTQATSDTGLIIIQPDGTFAYIRVEGIPI